MKNHSLAPWHHMEEREQIIDAEGNIVVYETNTSAADALLITAAPDLLAGLQAAVAEHANDDNFAWIEGAHAAIAKATGSAS